MVATNSQGPPEGGWGYVVAIGSALLFLSTISPFQAFGIVYNDFLSQFGDVTTSTTCVHTTFGAVSSFMGLVIKPLTTRFALRPLGICGAFFFCSGAFLCVFVQSVFQLVMAFGVLQGIGFGLMMPVALTSVNNYFERKRPFMNNLSQAGICAGTIFVPMAVEKLTEVYGFRGTVAILAAFSCNVFISMSIMQPVEWHMVDKTDIEMQTAETLTMDFKERSIEEKLTPETVKLLSEKKVAMNWNAPEKFKSSLPTIHSDSILNLKADPKKEIGFCRMIIDSMDLSLLKDPIYINMSFGIATTFLADFTLLTLAPMLLLHRGYSPSETAVCITASAVADLCSRTLLAIVASLVFIPSRWIIFTGSVVTVVLRIIFTMSDNYTVILFLFGGFGFVRSWIQTPIPLAFAEQYSNARFPAVWGLYMVFSGFIGLIIGPSIGVLSSIFHDDVITIHFLSFFTLLCIIPWIVELACCRRKSTTIQDGT